jgi:hypothetical protein
MNDSHRVFYWGPPGAGRSTSIARLARDSPPLVVGDQDYAAADSFGIQLALRHSSVLTRFYYDQAVPFRPTHVEAAVASLKEVGGIVFVCDSQRARREQNIVWLERLRADLAYLGRDIADIPIVFQLNKRDLTHLLTAEELKADLHTQRCGHVDSIAPKDDGPAAALNALVVLAGWPRRPNDSAS